MIAPLRLPDATAAEEARRLREARRVVASALLGARDGAGDRPRRITAWKAWLFAIWVAVVTGMYLASMLGWL